MAGRFQNFHRPENAISKADEFMKVGKNYSFFIEGYFAGFAMFDNYDHFQTTYLRNKPVPLF